jgi:transitional endoplasmic reticulum ATPase
MAMAIFGPPLTPKLAWEDFDHLGEERELAARVLAGAREQGASGINLLFHGPVGTGKTEFCKTLAAKCGLAIWSIGETDEQGGEPIRGPVDL